MTRRETGVPQQRHASAPASTADETAMTGNDGSTDFDLALESNEVLAAMDDAAFTRAVTRCLASHRNIFSAQQNNWASVRLAANLAPTLRGVAAEDAKRQDRATARAADAIADRADPDDGQMANVRSQPRSGRRDRGGEALGERSLVGFDRGDLAMPHRDPARYQKRSAVHQLHLQRARELLRPGRGPSPAHAPATTRASSTTNSQTLAQAEVGLGVVQRRSDVEGLGDDDDGTERRARRRTARAGKKERVAARLGKAKAEPEEYVEEAAADHTPIDEAEAKQKADEARRIDTGTSAPITSSTPPPCASEPRRGASRRWRRTCVWSRGSYARMRTLQKARNARRRKERTNRPARRLDRGCSRGREGGARGWGTCRAGVPRGARGGQGRREGWRGGG